MLGQKTQPKLEGEKKKPRGGDREAFERRLRLLAF